jgi:hypothetical protein
MKDLYSMLARRGAKNTFLDHATRARPQVIASYVRSS